MILLFLFSLFSIIPSHVPEASSAEESQVAVAIPFVQNLGQASDDVLFYSQTSRAGVFVAIDEDMGLVYATPNGILARETTLISGITHVVPTKRLETRLNFLFGSVAADHVPTYEEIVIAEIASGISLTLRYQTTGIEKLYTVSAQAKVTDLVIEIEDAILTVDGNGCLSITSDRDAISLSAPVAYQLVEDRRIEINASYVILDDSSYGFSVGVYDESLPLYIDPLLSSTFLGGETNDYVRAIEVAPDGSVIVAGSTDSTDFPFAYGYQESGSGSTDFFVARLDSDLTTLLSATYLGGSGTDDLTDLVIDATGNIYLAGSVTSSDFPGVQDGHQGVLLGTKDGVVAKLSSDLSSLLGASYVGGSDQDTITAIGVKNENVYVCGWTKSNDLSMLAGSHQPNLVGTDKYNGYFLSLSADLTSLTGATYINGYTASNVYADDLVVDSSGNAIIAGRIDSYATNSAFITTEGAFVSGTNGSALFIRSYSSDGSTLNASARYTHYTFSIEGSYGYTSGVFAPKIAITDEDTLYVVSPTWGISAYSVYYNITKMLRIDADLSSTSVNYQQLANERTTFTDIAIHPDTGYPYVSGFFEKQRAQLFFRQPGHYAEGIESKGVFISSIDPELTFTDGYQWLLEYTTYVVSSGTLARNSAMYLYGDYAVDVSVISYPTCAFDDDGNVYYTFSTGSSELSVSGANSYQLTSYGGQEIFIVKTNADLDGEPEQPEDREHDYESELTTTQVGHPEGGDTISLTHTLTNLGPDIDNDATVTIALSNLDAIDSINVTDVGTDTHEITASGIVLHLNALGLGDRVTPISITFKDDFSGSIVIQSTVSADIGSDPVSGNDTASIEFIVDARIQESDLFVTGNASENESMLGTYTSILEFGNNGPDEAENVVLEIVLDPRTTMISATPANFQTRTNDDGDTVVFWMLSSLAAGVSVPSEEGEPYRIVTSLNSGVVRGTLLHQIINVTSDNVDPDQTSEGSEESGDVWYGQIPGLSVEINDSGTLNETTIHTGEEYIYKAQLKNTGESTAYDVWFILTYESDMMEEILYQAWDQDFIDLSDDVEVDADLSHILYYAERVDPGDTITLEIGGFVDDWGVDDDFTFVLISSVSGKSDPEFVDADLNDLDQETVRILRPDLDVSVDFVDLDLPYLFLLVGAPGEWVDVEIDVSNLGRGDARPFTILVALDDPSGSVAALDNITVSDNGLEIVAIDDTHFYVLFSDEDDLLGMNGSETMDPDTGFNQAQISFSFLTEDGNTLLDGITVSAEVVYGDPDDSAADEDNANDQDELRLDFVTFYTTISVVGFVEPAENGEICQQYEMLFSYETTDPLARPLEDLEIYVGFPYLTETDIYGIALDDLASRPLLMDQGLDGGILFTNLFDVPSNQKNHLTIQLYSPVDDFDPDDYASNEFPVTTSFAFSLKGYDVVFEFDKDVTWALELSAPLITYPQTGEMCNVEGNGTLKIPIDGYAEPYSTVILYSSTGVQIALTTTDSSGNFSFDLNPETAISFYAKTMRGGELSRKSATVTLHESTHSWCPQSTVWISSAINGISYRFSFRDAQTGQPSTSNWQIKGVYGFWNSKLYLDVCCEDPSSVYVIADNVKYKDYRIVGDYYIFDIGYAHNVLIHVDCEDEKEEDAVGAVLIDPDGFVYDSAMGIANVVPGAEVTCYFYDPVNEIWTEWMAAAYNDQVNPQVVDETGYFAFYTPPGTYRLVVQNPEPYQSWISPDIVVVDELVTVNIPYTANPEADSDMVITADEDALLDGEGNDASVIEIEVGSIVEWYSETTDERLTERLLHPIIRIRSLIDVETDLSGFDSGMLMPGAIYRKQFEYTGTYVYTYLEDDTEMTGTIIVTGGEAIDTVLPTTPSGIIFDYSIKHQLSTLSWNASVDESGIQSYLVYRAIEGGLFELVGSSSTTDFTDEEVTFSSLCQYYIVAVDGVGNHSQHSEIVYAVPVEKSQAGAIVLWSVVGTVGLVGGLILIVLLGFPESATASWIRKIWQKTHGFLKRIPALVRKRPT